MESTQPIEVSTPPAVTRGEWFVDPQRGKDSNDGLSRETPFKHVQHALDVMHQWNSGPGLGCGGTINVVPIGRKFRRGRPSKRTLRDGPIPRPRKQRVIDGFPRIPAGMLGVLELVRLYNDVRSKSGDLPKRIGLVANNRAMRWLEEMHLVKDVWLSFTDPEPTGLVGSEDRIREGDFDRQPSLIGWHATLTNFGRYVLAAQTERSTMD